MDVWVPRGGEGGVGLCKDMMRSYENAQSLVGLLLQYIGTLQGRH